MAKKKKKVIIDYSAIDDSSRVIKQNVADATLEYMQIFGANKNLYRTMASLIDGMKPGKRRLIYSWWELNGRPSNTKPETLKKLKKFKVERLSSNATGNYHPHGSSSMDTIIGNEGQYWNNNVMLITPQGSYGNARGDKAAAGRYIEAALSEYTIDCFFDDFDEYCIPMREAYTGEGYEPEYLPAKYPHVLFNPQFSSIGYGLASNIAPFNVSEVLDATIALMKNPKAKISLIPDSPTGCDIVDNGDFGDINKIGVGKLKMRAKYEIDYVENMIHITALPYNVCSKGIIEKISELRNKLKNKNKDTLGIIDIADSTKEGEVDIKLYLAKDAKPNKVMKLLIKKDTGIQSTFPVGLTVIDNFKEYELSVRDVLLYWIDYRIDDVRSMFLNKLQTTTTKIHMNEVYMMVFNKKNIDTTISISRNSKSRQDAINKYMETFGISSIQAAGIADMKVYQFTEESYNRFVEDRDKLKKELEFINDILEDDDKIHEYIIEQLKEGKKKWGRPRMSRIIQDNDDSDIEDTEHVLAISESGYVKKLPLDPTYVVGNVGPISSNLTVLNISNKEDILIIDSTGNINKVPVSLIPDSLSDDIGVELNKITSVNGTIKAVMELPSMKLLQTATDNMCIIFVTKNGLAKMCKLSEFSNIKDVKTGISLNKGDEVAAAVFALDNSTKDIIISTNIGNGIRLPINEIRNLGSQAKGVQMISLKDGEEVVSVSLLNPKKKLMFMITSKGRAKVTEMKYFPTMNRKDSSVNLISLQGGEFLVGVSACDKNDVVEIYKKKSAPEKVDIKSLKIMTRVSKGERITSAGGGNLVIAYKIFG